MARTKGSAVKFIPKSPSHSEWERDDATGEEAGEANVGERETTSSSSVRNENPPEKTTEPDTSGGESDNGGQSESREAETGEGRERVEESEQNSEENPVRDRGCNSEAAATAAATLNPADGDSERDSEETDSDDETQPMLPEKLYIRSEFYNKPIKIATRCYVAQAVKNLKKVLTNGEMQWFLTHRQFHHFFHMKRDENHRTMGMYLLLLRTVKTRKKNEAWFMVNGVPIRYSLYEHALISGLDCHHYPENYESHGNMKFVEKHFKNKKVTHQEIQAKFMSMKHPNADRLKMGVLYFLSSIMKGSSKRGKEALAVDPFFQTVITDLDYCKTFPWGRFTFFDTLREINHVMQLFNGEVNRVYVNFPCFIIPLELLAFEAIPELKTKFREDEEEERRGCPRMCKTRFRVSSMKGFPIEEIHEALGEAKEFHSILRPSADEKDLMDDLYNPAEEDDVVDGVVDSWMKRLENGRPIWFEGLCKEDIEGREDKAAEKPTDKPNGTQKVNKGQEAESTFMTALKDMNDAIVARLEDMAANINALTNRVVQLEEMVVVLSNANLLRTPLENFGEDEHVSEDEKDEDEAEKEEEGEEKEDNEKDEDEAEKEKEGEEKEDNEKDDEENEGEDEEKEKEGLGEDGKYKTMNKKRKKSFSILRKSPFQVRETRLAKRGRKGDDKVIGA